LVVAQTSIISIFTNDAIVHKELKDTWYIWLLFNLFFMIQTVQSGVIRGTGNIAIGALLTCTVYLMIGAPLSKELAYDFDLGLQGIWIGACISSLFLVIGY
jgi:MATE family multidrug resistance protein